MKSWKLTGILAVVSVLALLCCQRTEGVRPEILVGAGAFGSTLVSPLVGWVQYGVYDAKEGPEIAVLQYGKITFLDSKTYAPKRTRPVHDKQIGYKELVSLRADGQLNLMAGGGGYQDVGWFDLEGHRFWTFKVESQYPVPPNKMIAVDLDGDGTKEFYVADNQGVFRLGADGQIVWRDDAPKLNHSLVTLPADHERPAAVVTGQGMWDGRGTELQHGIKSSVGVYMLQAVKWGESYCLASGQTSTEGGGVFVFDQTGKTVFKQSIGDWGVNDILAVRFKAGEPPSLVVVGGHGGASGLMELSIFSHDGTLVYQEIRKSERLRVIPDDARGVDTLLLCTGGIKKFEAL